MAECRLCAFADEADAALDGQIRALKRNKISLIELRGVDGENVADVGRGRAAEIKKRLDAEGIIVWSVGSPAGKVKITEPFAAELDRFRRLLDTSLILGAGNMRIFSFYGTGGGPEYRDEVLLRLSRFSEEAAGSGVVLCHENEKGIYGENAGRCAEIHAALPEIAAVFDPANFVQCGQDIMEAWEILGPRVRYCHIKDADASGRVVPPGEGVGRISEFLPRYFAAGGRVLTLEPHLSKFIGLTALEGGEASAVGGGRFESAGAAFDCAAASLRAILEKIGIGE